MLMDGIQNQRLFIYKKKGIAPQFENEDEQILKEAASKIDFMGVNYYQTSVCEYNPINGVTPYGTFNTTGVKGFRSSYRATRTI